MNVIQINPIGLDLIQLDPIWDDLTKICEWLHPNHKINRETYMTSSEIRGQKFATISQVKLLKANALLLD